MALRKRVKTLKNGLVMATKESGEFTLNIEDRQIKLTKLTTELEQVGLALGLGVGSAGWT